MIINVYSIKDTKVGFESPFIRSNDDVALRDFKSAALYGPEPNRFKQNPADYELYKLGTFNQATGELSSKVEFISNLAGVF